VIANGGAAVDEKQPTELEKAASEETRVNLLTDFGYFLLHNKKWWLLPILIILLLVSLLLLLSSTSIAPFIYTLF
jgi:hypothetical protein